MAKPITERENMVRALAYLLTREELDCLRRKLAEREDCRDAQTWMLLNDAALGDYRD